MNSKSKKKFVEATKRGGLYKITNGYIPAVIQTERHKTETGVHRAMSLDSLYDCSLLKAKKI